ncbi:hypothetical protein NKH77_49845 [Streptomyces sp. M19]
MTREAIDDFVDGALDTRTVDGKVYGLPMSLQPHAFTTVSTPGSGRVSPRVTSRVRGTSFCPWRSG